jgi:hypothetical protein
MNKQASTVIGALVVSALACTVNAELMYATTASGFFISFDSASPGNTLSGFGLQGLLQNEEVVGMDVRPTDGLVYALGSFGYIYTINPNNGVATSLGQMTGAVLNGSAFGFDFNPVSGLLRIHSDTEQNLRVNPDAIPITALVDGTLDYPVGDPNAGADHDISFAAYANNVTGATSTTLYAIDAHNDTLSRFATPNDGQLTTVGLLGADIGPRGGFDISGATGIAYLAALTEGSSQSRFYTVDLSTGVISFIDQIAGGLEIRTLTVVPAPASVALFAVCGIALRRRRA